MKETDLSRAIQRALAKLGIPCERVQSGKVRVRGGWMQLAGEGTPDLWTPLAFLECKVPKTGRLSEAQLAWHARAARWGVRVYVVRSAQEAVQVMRGELENREHSRAMGWE